MWEKEVRTYFEERGFDVHRLAEEGIHDQGDLEVILSDFPLIIECKDVSNLPIHETVVKAGKKAGLSYSAVVWKRKRLEKGNTKRTQVGKPIVCMTMSDFADLLRQVH